MQRTEFKANKSRGKKMDTKKDNTSCSSVMEDYGRNNQYDHLTLPFDREQENELSPPDPPG